MNVDPLVAAKVIGAIVLPLIGIGVVLFALISFVRPNGAVLREQKQKIKGFGLDMEVSVLTLFVLIGLTFSLVGTYLVVQDYESKLTELKDLRTKLDQAEATFGKALAQAKQVDVTALITLQDSGEQPLSPQQVRCGLHLFAAKTRELKVEPGVKPSQYYVTIDNVSQNELIQMLECQDSSSTRRWVLEKFNPLTPEYQLRKE